MFIIIWWGGWTSWNWRWYCIWYVCLAIIVMIATMIPSQSLPLPTRPSSIWPTPWIGAQFIFSGNILSFVFSLVSFHINSNPSSLVSPPCSNVRLFAQLLQVTSQTLLVHLNFVLLFVLAHIWFANISTDSNINQTCLPDPTPSSQSPYLETWRDFLSIITHCAT